MNTSLAVAASLVALGCGGDGGSGGGARSDGGSDVDAALDADRGCASDAECDDDLFCTGLERCDPGAAGADADGCLHTSAPCGAGETCDETANRCLSTCETSGDADGDGVDSVACGGDDCDDADERRYPGNVETCDATDHDEDCDVATYGFRDADGDGWPDARCCNADATGALACGDDCEDMRPTVHPTQAEVCDMLDNDCDGTIDEGTGATFYVDSDGDTYGTGDPVMTCGGGVGYAARGGDCDDTLPAVNPGADEICDTLDNDCNGDADEIVTTSPECPGIHCASIADAGTWGRRSGPNVGGYALVNEITDGDVTCAAGENKIRLVCAATGANLTLTTCYPASATVVRTRDGAILRFDAAWAGSDRLDFGAASVTRP